MNYQWNENTPLNSSGYIEHDLDGKKIAKVRNGSRTNNNL